MSTRMTEQEATDDRAEDAYVKADKEYQRAAKDSAAWCERRGALPAGSSRARVTTANAKWARAAEHRDRIEEQLRREFRAKQAAATVAP